MKQLGPRDYLEAPAWAWDAGTAARFDCAEGPVTLRLRGPKPEIREKLHAFLDARNTPGPARVPGLPPAPGPPGA